MNKIENLIDMAKLNELLGKKEEKKKPNITQIFRPQNSSVNKKPMQKQLL